jgi:hypothetical protein
MSDTGQGTPVGVGPERAARSDEDRELAERLVAEASEKGLEHVDPDGALTGPMTRVLEAGLEAELTEHLGYDMHAPEGRDGGSAGVPRVRTSRRAGGPDGTPREPSPGSLGSEGVSRWPSN